MMHLQSACFFTIDYLSIENGMRIESAEIPSCLAAKNHTC